MYGLKLIRAFTVTNLIDLGNYGFALPNVQKWHSYESSEWPGGLSFARYSDHRLKAMSFLAIRIAEETGKGNLPIVGTLNCNNTLFDEFKKGLIGVRWTEGDHVESQQIESLEKAQLFDNFTVSERFLTLNWLRKLEAQLAIPKRLEVGEYDIELRDLSLFLEIEENLQRRK